MKFTIKLLAIFTFTILLLNACKKDENQNQFYWLQTGCIDPWGASNESDSETKNDVIEYLENEDVNVNSIKIEFHRELSQGCFACSCRTGNKIIVEVKPEDFEKIRVLGFQEN